MSEKASARTIRTEYMYRRKVKKVNRSSDPNRAVEKCVGYMQINAYGATVAQVYDEATGQLHAEVKRSVSGTIQITFRRNPRDFVTPGTLEHFQRIREKYEDDDTGYHEF